MRKIVVIVGVIVLILAAIVWAAVYLPNLNKKVYGQVAGHKIYKEDIDQIRQGTTDISDHDATTLLLDKYFLEKLAKENGVDVSDEEIQKQLEKNGIASSSNYAKQNAANDIYLEKLREKVTTQYRGKFIIAYFNRYTPYEDVGGVRANQDIPGLGDPKLIEAEKRYAEAFINQIYRGITSGSINFEQASQQESSNPQIGKSVYPALPHSGDFNIPLGMERGNSAVETKDVRDALSKMNAGDTSRPFVVRVSNSAESDSTAESYWIILKLDDKRDGKTDSFDRYIQDEKTRLGYRYG